MSIARGTLCTVMCLLASLATGASGQEKKAWPPKEIKSTGKAWGVYMKPAKLEAIPDKGVLVAEADSEEEARKLADKFFNDPNNKFPRDLFSALKKNGGTDSVEQPTLTLEMPGGKKLVVPLSNVDPKPLPKAKPPIVDLVGKKAEGKVGNRKATFEFQKDHKLVIGGDVKGEGTWGLTEEKLVMSTKDEVFLGAVDKDGKMWGKRVTNPDGKDLRDWDASLLKEAAVQAAPDLAGTVWAGNYKRRPNQMGQGGDDDFKWGTKYHFEKNGICKVHQLGRVEEHKWAVKDNHIVVTDKDGYETTFSINGSTMSGRTTKLIDPRSNVAEYKLERVAR